MRDAITTLMNEHRLIERLLSALEACVRRGEVMRAELGSFVELIRRYADAHHHGKEEAILFTAMVEAGFSTESGPIAGMLADHAIGRRLTGVLDAIARGSGPLDADETRRLEEAAGGYVRLLRNHIQKEDRVLYPIALRALPAEAQAAVEARCASFEREQAGERERLERLAAELLLRELPRTGPQPGAAEQDHA
jgi:hemerythrin-like domain-containing protein